MKVINRTVWRTDHLKAILQRAAQQELEPEKRKHVIVEVVYARRHDGSSGCAVLGGRRMTMRLPKGPADPRWEPVACDAPDGIDPSEAGRFWIRWTPGHSWQSFLTEGERDQKLAQLTAQHQAAVRETQPGTPEHLAWRRNLAVAFAHTACHEMAHLRGMRHRSMPGRYRWTKGWQAYVSWAASMPLDYKVAQPAKRPTLDDRLAHVVRMREHAETRVRRAQTILKKWRRRERETVRRLAASRQVNGGQGGAS